MSVYNLKRTAIGLVAVSMFLFCGAAFADMPLNLTQGVTPTSQKVYDLHMTILTIVTIIGVVVFSLMIWSIINHRKSKNPVPAKFSHSTFAEITWTIIPILILVGLAIPATKTLIFMEQTGDAELTVKVTGYQWKWKYDYMDEGISFFSALAQESNDARQLGADSEKSENYLLEVDNPIVLPVETKVRILTTGADVIHSWWVPALGWKRDAIPGFINDNWTYIEKEGVYRGQCAELCGKDHGFMPIVVNAVSKEKYAAWVEEKKSEQAAAASGADREWSKEELMAKGKEVYGANCAACHQLEGQGVEGMFPALAGSPIVTGPAADHVHRVLEGKNLMPAFKSQLNDVDLAAVITYERNSWGNDDGDIVQPSDVKAAR